MLVNLEIIVIGDSASHTLSSLRENLTRPRLLQAECISWFWFDSPSIVAHILLPVQTFSWRLMTGLLQPLRAFSEMHQAMHATANPMTGLRKALPALSELFQARHASINLHPFDGREPELIEILQPDTRHPLTTPLRAFLYQSPTSCMVRSGGFSPVLRISDHLSQRQFEQTAHYRDFFAPAGLKDQLGFSIALPDTSVGVLFLRDRVFDDDEALMAVHLQRYIADRFSTQSGAKEHDPFRNAWRIPLDASGDAPTLPFMAREILDRFFNRGEESTTILPNVLQHWIRGLRRRREHTCANQVYDQIAIDRPHGRLQIAFTTTAMPPREILCLNEERGRHDFYRLKGLRLTERECEVIFWITQGKSDADISKILSTAQRTINKHVENVLLKLAANNRTAAAVRAVEWLADPTDELCQRW